MSDQRKSISVPADDYETIRRAAYWEGFKGPAGFALHVLMRHIEAREEERGSRYASIPDAAKDIEDAE